MGVTTAQPPADNGPRQLSDGNSLGTVHGQSPLDLISFYGATAIVQPGSQGSLRGQTGTVTVYATTQTPVSVAANTAAEQAFTVTGVAAGQLVIVNKPSAQAGLAVATARVSASNTIQVTFANDTAAAITPTATETYFVTAIPATMLNTAVLTPVAVQPATTAEQIFTVNTTLPTGAALAVNKPTAQAGLAILGARVVSSNQIGITYANLTAATITPTGGESYLLFAAMGVQIAPVMQTLTATLNPATVAANTSAEQTFTVPGLPAGTAVTVSKPSVTNGIGIGGARVSAVNTLAVTFVNDTAVSIDPPQEAYTIMSFPTAAPAAGSSTAFNAALGGGAYGSLVALGLLAGP